MNIIQYGLNKAKIKIKFKTVHMVHFKNDSIGIC